MKNLTNAVCEAVVRRLLREGGAPDVSGLGAVVEERGGVTTAVAFSRSLVALYLETLGDGEAPDAFDLQDVIEAAVAIGPPGKADGTLRGAKEIKMVAGPGAVAYGMAYALAGDKGIVPSRTDVSPSARAAWRGVAGSGRRWPQPIDNKFSPDHRTGAITGEHPFHTDDPWDDGRTWGPGDPDHEALDRVYYAEGWESGMLSRMRAAAGDLGLSREVVAALVEAGEQFFEMRWSDNS